MVEETGLLCTMQSASRITRLLAPPAAPAAPQAVPWPPAPLAVGSERILPAPGVPQPLQEITPQKITDRKRKESIESSTLGYNVTDFLLRTIAAHNNLTVETMNCVLNKK